MTTSAGPEDGPEDRQRQARRQGQRTGPEDRARGQTTRGSINRARGRTRGLPEDGQTGQRTRGQRKATRGSVDIIFCRRTNGVQLTANMALRTVYGSSKEITP